MINYRTFAASLTIQPPPWAGIARTAWPCLMASRNRLPTG